MSDTVAVAIVKIGGQTYIVSPGDMITDKIKVSTVDALKGLVVLEEDGERFELRMGGVSGAHVAPASSSNN